MTAAASAWSALRPDYTTIRIAHIDGGAGISFATIASVAAKTMK